MCGDPQVNFLNGALTFKHVDEYQRTEQLPRFE